MQKKGAIDPESLETQQEVPQEAMTPQQEKEAKTYISGLMKMLHGQETSQQVVNMLSAAPPEQSVPQAAMVINAQMEEAVTQKAQKPTLDTLLAAGVYLTSDLIEIGNAAGLWQLQEEDQIAPILKGVLQGYIEAGLKDGSIDPVELQQKVEPLMSQDLKETGARAAELSGVPPEPNETVAMESYARGREMKAGRAAEKKVGMLQGNQEVQNG